MKKSLTFMEILCIIACSAIILSMFLPSIINLNLKKEIQEKQNTPLSIISSLASDNTLFYIIRDTENNQEYILASYGNTSLAITPRLTKKKEEE